MCISGATWPVATRVYIEKSVARMFVWWPGMDKDIEELVKECSECNLNRDSPPKALLQPWKWPTRLWARVHFDYAGPVEGKMFLVIIDAHVQYSTSQITVQKLRATLQDLEFQKQWWLIMDLVLPVRNGVTHIKTAPYHPSSIGLAERAVRILKEWLRKMKQGTLEDKLARFLFQYRLTPQTTTGVSPGELMMGRRLRTRLDAIFPKLENQVTKRQWKQRLEHDVGTQTREFTDGERVYVKFFFWKQERLLSAWGQSLMSYCVG